MKTNMSRHFDALKAHTVLKNLISKSKLRHLTMVVAAALVAVIGLADPAAAAYTNQLTYTGQGLVADGFGGYDLISEICGVANGAEVDGPYLLWVVTATGAQNADITGPWGTANMLKTGNGTFKYVSGWYEPSTLPGHVTASYDGRRTNAQVTIGHGCRPFRHGAWCSPGFWKNADDAAWALTGYTKADLFNGTVVPGFYDTAFVANPTLYTTLSEIAYRSSGLTSGPYGLTPFNATGAFLTDNIPGYQFDPSAVNGNESDTCPIDSHGNVKAPQS